MIISDKFIQVSEAQGLDKTRLNEIFACKDNSNMYAILNDDYCDCADGLDEPLSNACSHILVAKHRFNCGGSEQGTYIYVSRVNDGVCDCRNGADEWLKDPDYCAKQVSRAAKKKSLRSKQEGTGRKLGEVV